MELQEAAQAIQEQGMTLQEAKLKGYTDPITGQAVPGELSNAARELNLKGLTYALQEKELMGYWDAQKGYVAGTIENMSNEQKAQAYSLYGGVNPTTGQYVKGTLQQAQDQATAALNLERDRLDKQYDIDNRQTQITEANEASRAYWDTATKFSTYAQTHLDLDASALTKANSFELFDKDRGVDVKITGDKLTPPYNDPSKFTLQKTNYDVDLMSPEMKEIQNWYKAKYGSLPNLSGKAGDEFRTWAATEWKAATDSRLTNPIDASIYSINSSSLSTEDKKKMIALLTSTPGVEWTTDVHGNFVPIQQTFTESKPSGSQGGVGGTGLTLPPMI